MPGYPAWNLEKLSDDARALICYYMHTCPTGWTLTYMLEVRLDDPIRNICEGGEGLVAHGGNGSPRYAHHVGEEDWAVIHVESTEWMTLENEALLLRGHNLVERLREKARLQDQEPPGSSSR